MSHLQSQHDQPPLSELYVVNAGTRTLQADPLYRGRLQPSKYLTDRQLHAVLGDGQSGFSKWLSTPPRIETTLRETAVRTGAKRKKMVREARFVLGVMLVSGVVASPAELSLTLLTSCATVQQLYDFMQGSRDMKAATLVQRLQTMKLMLH